MSGAPTLPREVWCFVEEVGDEQFPDTLVTTLTSERDLAAWREGVLRLKEAELSPIGRYVLADDRGSARPQCSGEWVGGSGGHREHTHCAALATFWDEEDPYAYCNKHIKDHDRGCYRNRYVERRTTCPVCLAAHGPVTVCHECVRLKAKREEREDIVAWLRRDSTRETEPAAWDYADAIERGEHRRDGR